MDAPVKPRPVILLGGGTERGEASALDTELELRSVRIIEIIPKNAGERFRSRG